MFKQNLGFNNTVRITAAVFLAPYQATTEAMTFSDSQHCQSVQLSHLS